MPPEGTNILIVKSRDHSISKENDTHWILDSCENLCFVLNIMQSVKGKKFVLPVEKNKRKFLFIDACSNSKSWRNF